MKVKRISRAGRADVYNMEVEGTHSFAVQGGVIVHNCYDELRYVLMENPIAAPRRREPAVERFDPLATEEAAYWDKYGYYMRRY